MLGRHRVLAQPIAQGLAPLRQPERTRPPVDRAHATLDVARGGQWIDDVMRTSGSMPSRRASAGLFDVGRGLQAGEDRLLDRSAPRPFGRFGCEAEADLVEAACQVRGHTMRLRDFDTVLRHHANLL